MFLSALVLSLCVPMIAGARAVACDAQVELIDGSTQVLKQVTHGMLEKQYPYLIGQEGADITMLSFAELKQAERLEEHGVGDMIGLIVFQAETLKNDKHKLGLNGSTYLMGQGKDGEERVPFARIRKIILDCP
ncbi:hypothetical protein AAU61_11990 [Desulfocarbo indianensis]|nr:hypothetical protein AAU61_11990 [Desulfocarbo indianensis]